MVHLLALGIPGSGATAVMLGALMLYGLKPGPMMFHTNPDFVWALIASMFIGNAILIVMNLPMIPLFAMGLRIPYRYLYPGILLICIIGAYSLKSNAYDVWVMLIFGVIGYLMKKFDIPGAPMVIALILGPMLEYNLYRALALSTGRYDRILHSTDFRDPFGDSRHIDDRVLIQDRQNEKSDAGGARTVIGQYALR